MKTVTELLGRGIETLERVGIGSAKADARRILSFVLGAVTGRLAGMSTETVLDHRMVKYIGMIDQRALRKPVSQIVGYRDFWKYRFKVTRDVLDPRPETELLVEQALCQPFSRVLDLGTGTGAIFLSLLLEMPEATGIATDISEFALEVARENPMLIDDQMFAELQKRGNFLLSDWFEKVTGQFDLIVSNPPYISAAEMDGLSQDVNYYEPHMALTDHGDGLGAYRKIVPSAPDFLIAGGRLIVEIGPTQAEQVMALFAEAGFENIVNHPDLDGRDRVVSGVKSGNNPA